MGLFGKMFEKKECSICGGEIGLLGNRKLAGLRNGGRARWRTSAGSWTTVR